MKHSPSHVFLVTCEHGGNFVPAAFADRFESPRARILLRGHRGYDPGALDAAVWFAKRLDCASVTATTTRLLVDLNRSPENPSLWSQFSKSLDASRQQSCLKVQYFPYRDRVKTFIEANLARGVSVTHLSMHTFTPRLAGVSRKLDVGLLFDPARETENRLCGDWLQSLESRREGWRVAANRPYCGTDDGLTTWMRVHLLPGRRPPGQYQSAAFYRGIEIELTNRIVQWRPQRRERLMTALLETLLSIRPESE